jgi:hypothetical protein
MSKPKMTEIAYELVEGIERNKRWIRRIGFMGVILGAVFAALFLLSLSSYYVFHFALLTKAL